jgi:hypothetical protein
MQCLAYIISFLVDHEWSGCHFPVSGDIEGFTDRFRGRLTATLGAGRVETGSTVPICRVIELILSKEGIFLKRNLASFLSLITVSRPSISEVFRAGVSKRLWCLGTERSRGNSRSSKGRAKSIAAESA